MKGRILIIDDDSTTLITLMKPLIDKGHDVQTAKTGEDGLKLVPEFKPHLVILDTLLPGISGYEVLTEMRKMKDFENTTVFAVSVKKSMEDIFKDSNVQQFYSKPLDLEKFQADIDKVIKQAAKDAPPENPEKKPEEKKEG